MKITIQPNEIYAAHLASYLMRKGMTLTQYASLVGVATSTTWHWVSGTVRCPQTKYWIRLCKIHGVDFDRPQRLGFTPRSNRRLGIPGYRSMPGAEGVDVTDLLRRNLTFAAAGAFLATPVYAPIAKLLDVDARVRLHVGASDVARLREKARVIQAAGDLSGGAAMDRGALLAESERCMSLLKGTFVSEDVRSQAHGAAASLTQYVGWQLFDQGFHDGARRMWAIALAMSRGAPPEYALPLQAHVFHMMAYQAIATGEPQTALDLLGMLSGREASLSLLQRADLSVLRAHATAAIGDVDETRRHITWAQDHINEAADERDAICWNLNGWFHEAELNAVTSKALATLAIEQGHRRDEALERASTALAGYPPHHVRQKARVANTALKLHAANRDAAETERAGAIAVDLVRRVKSPRVLGELFAVRPYLAPMRNHAGIRDLEQDIADAVKVRKR